MTFSAVSVNHSKSVCGHTSTRADTSENKQTRVWGANREAGVQDESVACCQHILLSQQQNARRAKLL